MKVSSDQMIVTISSMTFQILLINSKDSSYNTVNWKFSQMILIIINSKYSLDDTVSSNDCSYDAVSSMSSSNDTLVYNVILEYQFSQCWWILLKLLEF